MLGHDGKAVLHVGTSLLLLKSLSTEATMYSYKCTEDAAERPREMEKEDRDTRERDRDGEVGEPSRL